MTYDARKRPVLPAIPATTKLFIVCPVCGNSLAEVLGLVPYQTLARHYRPGTQEQCPNHGRDFRESVTS